MIPRSVLLVEDNEDDSYLANRILRKIGVEIIRIASDGKKALDMLFTSEDPLPDLVLLDLKLPMVDGVSVLKEIRGQATTKSIPVVILTSSEDPTDREKCQSLCIHAYLTKPLAINDLSQLFHE